MEGSFANELYGESLRVSTPDPVAESASGGDDDSLPVGEDGSSWGNSDVDLNGVDDLEREWEKRREQFHKIGYRDGITSGKEAAAQEGFNFGFKQSLIPGFNWGIVRGVTSALSILPGQMQEKLIEKEGVRRDMGKLQKAVYSFSTEDSFKLYHNDMVKSQNARQNQEAESCPRAAEAVEQRSMESYAEELRLYLSQAPVIGVKFAEEMHLAA